MSSILSAKARMRVRPTTTQVGQKKVVKIDNGYDPLIGTDHRP
jgi:hypothetical protein